MKKFLLHVCCAPCSPYVVEQLREKYDLALYFYNPNIHPESEYFLRLEELQKWCADESLNLIEAPYEVEDWFSATKGLADEPERGRRCSICIAMRLQKTAEQARQIGADIFGAVLSISPHKSAVMINRLGSLAGDDYDVAWFTADWKKKEGFKKTVAIGRELDFYRQDYCGCVYSIRK